MNIILLKKKEELLAKIDALSDEKIMQTIEDQVAEYRSHLIEETMKSKDEEIKMIKIKIEVVDEMIAEDSAAAIPEETPIESSEEVIDETNN